MRNELQYIFNVHKIPLKIFYNFYFVEMQMIHSSCHFVTWSEYEWLTNTSGTDGLYVENSKRLYYIHTLCNVILCMLSTLYTQAACVLDHRSRCCILNLQAGIQLHILVIHVSCAGQKSVSVRLVYFSHLGTWIHSTCPTDSSQVVVMYTCDRRLHFQCDKLIEKNRMEELSSAEITEVETSFPSTQCRNIPCLMQTTLLLETTQKWKQKLEIWTTGLEKM